MSNWFATNWYNTGPATLIIDGINVTLDADSFDVVLPDDDVVQLESDSNVSLEGPNIVSLDPDFDVEEN